MPAAFAPPQLHTEPGIAGAEGGFVVLDGPGAIALTMTHNAAARTGHSLVSAAEAAKGQIANGTGANDD